MSHEAQMRSEGLTHSLPVSDLGLFSGDVVGRSGIT